MSVKRIIGLSVLLISAILLVGLSTCGAGHDSKKYGGELIWAHVDEFPYADPYTYSGGAQRLMTAPVYSTLFQYESGGGFIKDLATSFKVIEPKVFEVKIRDDVKFHNGTPLDIHDVVYSYNRIKDPEVGAHLYTAFQVVEKMEVLDDYTLRFHLKKVVPPSLFKENITQIESAILSEDWMKDHPNWDYSEHMGSGPFMWEEIVPGDKVILKRNPDYYKFDEEGNRLPYLDRVILKTYRDPALRMSAMKTGEIDTESTPPWSAYSTYEKDSNIIMREKPGAFMGIIFNLTREPFDNKLVRKAIAYAVNRQDVLDFAFYGYGEPVTGGPLAAQPWSLAYNPKNQGVYEYNPEKAKELLEEAGYPDGFSAKLFVSGSDQMHVDTGTAVLENLNDIGLDISLRMKEWPRYLDTLTEGDYEFAILCELNLTRDPNWLRGSFHKANTPYSDIPHGWDYPELDKILDEARSTLEEEKRKELYWKWEDMFLEECPEIFLVQRGSAAVQQDWVHDWQVLAVPKTQLADGLERTWIDETSPRK